MNKRPRRAAQDWWLRQQAGPLTEREAQALRDWLHDDAAHGEALAELEMQWALAGELADRPVLAAPERRRRPARPIWLAAAAALLLIIGWRAPGWWLQTQADYQTGAGEIRALTLNDGSRVTLAANSAIRMAYNDRQRELELLRGEALFHPAPITVSEPRPFTVTGNQTSVTARGTVFWVRRRDRGDQVGVIEHSVLAALPASGRQQRVDAGASVRLDPDQGIRPLPLNPAQAARWTQGVLVFEAQPLGHALARINTFGSDRVVLLNRAKAEAPVSAVLHLDNLDSGVDALARSLNLEVLDAPGLTFLY